MDDNNIEELIDSAFKGSEIAEKVERSQHYEARLHHIFSAVECPVVICSHKDIRHPDARFAVIGNGLSQEATEECYEAYDFNVLELIAGLFQEYAIRMMQIMIDQAYAGAVPTFIAPENYRFGPVAGEEE